jgi:sulfate adenylyltransferase
MRAMPAPAQGCPIFAQRPFHVRLHSRPDPELYVSSDSAQKLKVEAGNLPSWDLTARQVCDLELLMNGGFFPLKGFLSRPITTASSRTCALADGTLWPIPVTLDVSEAFADKVEPGQDIALRDQKA